MKRYSVALVYQINRHDKLSFALRTHVIPAVSKEEALGKAMQMKKEDKSLTDYMLFLDATIEIAELPFP